MRALALPTSSPVNASVHVDAGRSVRLGDAGQDLLVAAIRIGLEEGGAKESPAAADKGPYLAPAPPETDGANAELLQVAPLVLEV